MMLNKTKYALLVGGIAALSYAYFTKLENREQVKTTLKNTKTKMASYADTKKHKPTQMNKAGFSDPHDPDDNRMVEEGAMTSVQYFNEKVQEPDSKSEAKNAFPKSQQKKLPKKAESLHDANNQSPAKQQNTDHNAEN